jgi:hypothetical protein
MPLFVIGFCYSIPLACGSTDALSHIMYVAVGRRHRCEKSHCREKPSSVTRLDEGYSMETSQRDVLLGTITWWGFHVLLMWMGAWHFFSRDLTDGALFASDLFAGSLMGATALSLLRLSVGCHLLRFISIIGILLVVYHAWQGKAGWGNLTDVAIWGYTFYSFGPSSWRYTLYSPLGVFGKLKT